MPAKRKKNTDESIQRKSAFMELFRKFDSVGDGAKWIASACGVQPITVMVWRLGTKNGYSIPARQFQRLMEKIESNPPPNL